MAEDWTDWCLVKIVRDDTGWGGYAVLTCEFGGLWLDIFTGPHEDCRRIARAFVRAGYFDYTGRATPRDTSQRVR